MQVLYPTAVWCGSTPQPGATAGTTTAAPERIIDVTDAALAARGTCRPRLVIAAGLGCVAAVPAGVHFGICGPWDVAATQLDGQQGLGHHDGMVCQFDTVGGGDVVVLTSDGGDASRVWSAKQLDALVGLGAWWCRELDAVPELARTASDAGIVVPGPLTGDLPALGADGAGRALGRARLAQLSDMVIPGIRTALRRQAALLAPTSRP